MNLIKYKSDILVIIHFLLGILAGFIPSLVFFWVMGAFFLGFFSAFDKSVSYPEYLFLAYLVGIELLGRMSASGLPHEFIKYAVSLIILVSLLRKPRRIAYPFIIFILLLLPAVLLTDGGSSEQSRQLISANLSGPFCLAISALYFYNKSFNVNALRELFLFILFPLASILGYLLIRTPDIAEIEFGFQSNFATSVYGPNQMSSILGLGILIIGLSYFLRIRLFGSYLLTLVFLAFLLFRGLLTFSRGGMLTPAILLVLIFLYSTWKVAGFNRNTIRTLFFAGIISVVAVLAFNYTNTLTGNKLFDRYAGKKGGKQIEDIDKLTSSRAMITYLDWQIFMDYPVLGVGAGMGQYFRMKHGLHSEVAAHNEFTRMLAEHGSLGVIVILIMVITPLKRFFVNIKTIERIFVIAFIGFCFIFMTHSATRIAAPCFLFGLAFIKIVPLRHSLVKRNNFLSQ